MPLTALNVCEDVAREIGALAEGNTLSAGDANYILGKLNRVLDNWNADRAAVYAQQFATFTLTPSLSPHTIGLAANTPTWTVTGNRPEKIDSASLILTGGSLSTYQPITIWDHQWWADQVVPGLSTSIPTDLYYQPSWPNGQLFFWPVPTTAYQVELETRIVLAQLVLADTFTLPPGYRDAITLSVAEECCGPFGLGGSALLPDLRQRAGKARARVFAVNDVTPRLATQDSGMPGGRGSYLNWRSGLPF